MTNQLQDDVLDIIATKGMVARDTLALDKKLADLNISSLDVVEIVFALEDKFNIEIPFNANQSAEQKLEFNTIGEVVAAVEKLVRAKAA
ncbi:MAG: acyl carrier protein [Bdellovibrionales bacterium]